MQLVSEQIDCRKRGREGQRGREKEIRPPYSPSPNAAKGRVAERMQLGHALILGRILSVPTRVLEEQLFAVDREKVKAS